MRFRKIALVCIGAAIVALGAGVWTNIHGDTRLALDDKQLGNDSLELCSPYANLCLTRPANWTRSRILHVEGTRQDTIEINPPTGTILQFSKQSTTTDVICSARSHCSISVYDIGKPINGLLAFSGVLIERPDQMCEQGCAITGRYTPFVQLVSEAYIRSKKIAFNKDTSFTHFNPAVSYNKNSGIFVQITPGKSFTLSEARQWLHSDEATTAVRILSSVRAYKK